MDIKPNQAAAAYGNTAKMAGRLADGAGAVEGIDPLQGPSFSDLVSESMTDAADTGYKTEAISTKSLANKAELHDLVTAVANAELTLNTVVAIRDKVISAYHDIVKMPI